MGIEDDWVFSMQDKLGWEGGYGFDIHNMRCKYNTNMSNHAWYYENGAVKGDSRLRVVVEGEPKLVQTLKETL